MNMKINVGTPDRAIRVIVGLGLIALAATGTVGAKDADRAGMG